MFLNLTGRHAYPLASVDHVRLDQRNNKSEAVTKDGDRFRVWNRDLPWLGACAVIPAEPGWRVLSFDGDEALWETPVLAWAVGPDGTYPVTLEGIDDDWLAVSPPNSDRVIAPYVGDWDDREQARRELLEMRRVEGRPMNAAAIARALDPKAARSGRNWVCRCPCHDDRTASLSLADGRDGKLLVKCFAGCDPRAILDHLRAKGWIEDARPERRRRCGTIVKRNEVAEPDPRVVSEAARILAGCVPLAGTPGETYLRSRGLRDPGCPDLLFHDDLTDYANRCGWPALIGVVRDAHGQPTGGVHRTYLLPDGSGKAPTGKLTLGPCRGGGVWLCSTIGDEVAVSEGIETGLSVQQAVGVPVVAALSTSGMRALTLPPTIRRVTVLADGDDPGEAAARDAGQRWAIEGRRVRIARPPRGMDFNGILAKAGTINE